MQPTGRLQPTEPTTAAKVSGGLVANFGARVHIDIEIPRTSIKARMRLADRAESLAVTSEARRMFKALSLVDESGRVVGIAADDWNAEIAVRYLAVAIRNPDDVTKPLDSLEEWRLCDDDQIEALWSMYRDLRAQLDPLGDVDSALSDAEMNEIEAAVKKKESAVLMSFGSRKLALYTLTSAARLASSTTPKS